MHYTESFHRKVPEKFTWFRYPFLVAALALLVLQWSEFYTTVKKRGALK